MPPIKAILFDCDNTLVLSESLAFEACADLANEILAQFAPSYNKTYTAHELQIDFVGQNFGGMIRGMEDKYNFKMSDAERQAYVERELGKVIEKLTQKAEPCPGVDAVLAKLQRERRYEMGIVSTSAMSRIVASIEKVGQDRFFDKKKIFSAASSLNPPSSKPNPAIYHHACKEMGKKEGECVAIEDSKSGGTAAMRAGIPLIGYVGPYYEEGGIEKVKQMEKLFMEELGAVVVMHNWKDFESCLQKVISS